MINAQRQAASFLAEVKATLTPFEFAQFKTLVTRLKSLKRHAAEEDVHRQVFESAAALFATQSELAIGFKIFVPPHMQDDYLEFMGSMTAQRVKPAKHEETKEIKSVTVRNFLPEDQDKVFVEETEEENDENNPNEDSGCDEHTEKHNGVEDLRFYDSLNLQKPCASAPHVIFEPNIIPGKLWNTLFPFQKEGVEKIVKAGGRMLVADEMGLGKTMTALAVAAHYHKTDWPALVVCPAGLRKVWEDGFRKWLPTLLVEGRSLFAPLGSSSGLCVLDSEHANRVKPGAKVIITSYDLLAALPTEFDFGLVICDESHFLKSPSSLRTKHMMPLMHKARRLLLLSGTPCLATSSELFTQLHALSPLASPSAFASHYGNNQNLGELHRMLQSFMIRRLKQDVLPEMLPPKTRKFTVLEAGSKQSIAHGQDVPSRSWQQFSRELASGMEGQNLSGQVLQLYMQAGVEKLKQVCQYVLRLCVDPANKVLVFGHHKQVLGGVQHCLKQVGIAHIFVDGQVTGIDRATRLARFQNEIELRVAVLSLTAVGQGATLTAANHCVFAELSWTPGQLLQAEDRVHRLGQTRPTCIHYLIGSGSLDEALWPLLERKLAITGQCLDGQNNESLNRL